MDLVLAPINRAQRRALDRQRRVIPRVDALMHAGDVFADALDQERVVGFRDRANPIGEIRHGTPDPVVFANQFVDHAHLRHHRRIVTHAHHTASHSHRAPARALRPCQRASK
jgi:hypothetical protein